MSRNQRGQLKQIFMFRYSGPPLDEHVYHLFGAKKAMGFVDKMDSYWNVIVHTRVQTRVSAIRAALERHNATKGSNADKVHLRPLPYEDEIITISRIDGESLQRHGFYKRVMAARAPPGGEDWRFFEWQAPPQEDGDDGEGGTTRGSRNKRTAGNLRKKLSIQMTEKVGGEQAPLVATDAQGEGGEGGSSLVKNNKKKVVQSIIRTRSSYAKFDGGCGAWVDAGGEEGGSGAASRPVKRACAAKPKNYRDPSEEEEEEEEEPMEGEEEEADPDSFLADGSGGFADELGQADDGMCVCGDAQFAPSGSQPASGGEGGGWPSGGAGLRLPVRMYSGRASSSVEAPSPRTKRQARLLTDEEMHARRKLSAARGFVGLLGAAGGGEGGMGGGGALGGGQGDQEEEDDDASYLSAGEVDADGGGVGGRMTEERAARMLEQSRLKARAEHLKELRDAMKHKRQAEELVRSAKADLASVMTERTLVAGAKRKMEEERARLEDQKRKVEHDRQMVESARLAAEKLREDTETARLAAEEVRRAASVAVEQLDAERQRASAQVEAERRSVAEARQSVEAERQRVEAARAAMMSDQVQRAMARAAASDMAPAPSAPAHPDGGEGGGSATEFRVDRDYAGGGAATSSSSGGGGVSMEDYRDIVIQRDDLVARLEEAQAQLGEKEEQLRALRTGVEVLEARLEGRDALIAETGRLQEELRGERLGKFNVVKAELEDAKETIKTLQAKLLSLLPSAGAASGGAFS